MYVTPRWFVLIVPMVAAVPQPQAEPPAMIVSPIVSVPASVSSQSSEIDAYLSSVITGSVFQSASSHIAIFNIPNGDGVRRLGYQGTNPAALYGGALPTAVSELINSIASVERSIYHTTVPDSVVLSSQALFASQVDAFNAYISQLSTEAAWSSISSAFQNKAPLRGIEFWNPLIEQFGDQFPEDVRSIIRSVLSRENELQHATVTKVYVSGVDIPFPSTTITEGVYAATPLPTPGTSVQSAGPAATGSSSSSSTAAAPTVLGCGGSCGIMLGAMVGMTLGAVTL